ncbi:MAG: peroxide stress protein YaaA [Ancrocorticia sp.]
MRILLPPSEGKTPPASGPTLDLSILAYPELTDARAAVVDELIKVSRRDDALAILKAGERIRPEVEAQRELWSLPCAPAREVYTGVLYEAAQLREGDDVTIFSGLFGATGGEDLIPAYRLSMNVKLPRAGALKTYWRRHLKAEMFAAEVSESATDAAYDPNQVTVDMRSGAYLVWNPPGPWWDVRVRDSSGKVITHMAKHYRGLLTRALLDAKSDDVAAVARTLGTVEVDEDGLKRHLTLTPTDA